jgi:carbon-monoxide dehydrogenase small subunit
MTGERGDNPAGGTSTVRTVNLTVNGTAYSLAVEPRRLLADVVRDELGLTGTHLGCEQGSCGACTVLMNGVPVRSCLVFAVAADGQDIVTVEGLGQGEALHPVQTAFIAHHALQCGFCTPGFLVTAAWLVEHEPGLTRDEIRERLSGNLCRCTGYEQIVDAVEAAMKEGASVRH